MKIHTARATAGRAIAIWTIPLAAGALLAADGAADLGGCKLLVYSFPVRDALELFVISRDGTGQRQLTTFGGTSVCTASAWSPDGRWISFRRTDER